MLTDTLVLSGIDGYRRYVSPHKGFRCAHAALFGGSSCSEAVRAIIARDGLREGWGSVRHRFGMCRSAYAHLRGAPRGGSLQAQGVCCCGPIPIPFRCG